MTSASVAVVGVGNPLMGDDGVGIAVIRELARQSLPAHVALFDAGTSLLDILPEVAHCERIILVDCCRAGGEPGTLCRTPMDLDRLASIQQQIMGNCLCVLGDAMAMPVSSLLVKFRAEFEQHIEQARAADPFFGDTLDPSESPISVLT